jgi:hypothetical protein
MSREELVGAYVHGAVSRRVFIRGLVALGVSAGAAVAYADVLTSSAVAQSTTAAVDIYPTTTTTAAPTTTTTAAPTTTTTTAGSTTTTAADGTTTTTADSGVAAGQVGQAAPATAVETDPTFAG